MLGVNQLDFINYTTALKGNYRKGVHKLEAILANPTHAAEFAANLGGVSVVLGVPIGKEDKNSEALRALLLGSPVADAATYTWLGQFYEFTSWDDLLGNAARCQEMMADPLIWRALAGSGMAVGKAVATLAGLSCSAYADMTAVAASSTAMTAVAASQTAMAAVIANSTALNAVVSSSTAMTAVAASQTAMAAVIANSTALNAVVSSQTAMTAVAASHVAVAAIYGSTVAVDAVKANGTAWATLTGASSGVMGKAVATLAGLNPDSYADMTAVAASSTAMAAVIANSTALNAVVSSSTAMTAVAASQTAMTAVAASSTAMAAVAASQTALNAIAASTAALDALYAKKSRLSGASASKSGKFIILQISTGNAFDTSNFGYATLSDGSKPNWSNYKGKYAYFKQYKKVATQMKNDTDSDDWIDYISCG